MFEAVRALTIAFIQDENISDFHQSRFQVLHIVAHARHQHHDGAIGKAHDFDFALPDSYGLDDDHIFSRRVQKQSGIPSRLRETSEESARRHRTNEHARVRGVSLHANAIAQNRAAGKWARRINRNDPNALFFAAIMRCQPVNPRALASPGRAGNSDAVGISGMREKRPQNLFRLRIAIFYGRNRPRNRPDVSRAHLLGPSFDGCDHFRLRHITGGQKE